jgi:ABC-type uncharacterized transport system permease subunit
MKFGEKNVGKQDQAVRAAVAIVLIAAVAGNYIGPPLSYLALILAFIMAATAALGTCGLYSLFGVNTCKLGTKK